MAFIFGYFGSILGFFILGGIWGLAMGLNEAIENMLVEPLYKAIAKLGKWSILLFLPVASLISTVRKLINYLPIWAILYGCMWFADMPSDTITNNILFLAHCFGIIHASIISHDYYKEDKRTSSEKFSDESLEILARHWAR